MVSPNLPSENELEDQVQKRIGELEKTNQALKGEIIECKKNEEMLAFQAQLFSKAREAVFSIDTNYIINYWNEEAEKLFGWTKEEALGKESGELLKTKIESTSRAQEIPKLWDKGYWEGEVQYLRKDGTYSLVDVKATVLKDTNGKETGIVTVARDITESKRAEETLQESEAKYHGLFNSMAEAFELMEPVYEKGKPIDCIFLDVNPAWERMTGLKKEQVLGRKVSEVIGFVESYWPEAMDRALRTGEIVDIENYGVALDKWYSVNMWKFSDIACGVTITDITERKRAEAEIQKLMASVQQEKERLSALVNSIPDEIWFADNQKKVTLVNPAVLKNFGNSTFDNPDVEVIARNLEVYRPDGTPRPVEEAPLLRALKREIIKNQEETIRIPVCGELRYRQVNAAPVKDASGNIIGSLSVVRDITKLKQAEEALKIANETLEEKVGPVVASVSCTEK